MSVNFLPQIVAKLKFKMTYRSSERNLVIKRKFVKYLSFF
ncbi:hypothetical protein Thermo_00559 [Thermoplasmatales archaeon]|nr:hypothetical protein Thermo_00559 [Thermoplasmatales archaeon]